MLAEKELRKRKIMKLFEEMNKSLLSVFDSIRMKQEEDK